MTSVKKEEGERGRGALEKGLSRARIYSFFSLFVFYKTRYHAEFYHIESETNLKHMDKTMQKLRQNHAKIIRESSLRIASVHGKDKTILIPRPFLH